MPFNLQLPDGTVLEGIPDGTTKEQVRQKLLAKGMAFDEPTQAPVAPITPPSAPKDTWSLGNLKDSIVRGNKQAALGVIQAFAPNLYPEEMAQQAKELEQEGKGTGTLGFVGEALGDPKNYLLGYGVAAKGAPLVAKIGALGATGAGAGALQPVTGATSDDRQNERARNAIVSGVGSAVIPPVAGYVGGKLGSGVKKLSGLIKDAKLSPEQKAENIITEGLNLDKILPSELQQTLKATNKTTPQALIQDIVEKKVDDVPINPSITKQIGNYASGFGGEDVAKGIASRQNMRVKRIEALLDNTLSQKGSYNLNKQAMAAKQDIANNLRQKAMEYPVNIKADDIVDVLKSSKEGRNLLSSVDENLKMGITLGQKQPTTTEYLDTLKKALDRRASDLYNPNADAAIKDSAANFKSISGLLKDRMKEQNPLYAKYLKDYGDELSNQQALKEGLDFLKLGTDELKDKFGKLSNTEKEF